MHSTHTTPYSKSNISVLFVLWATVSEISVKRCVGLPQIDLDSNMHTRILFFSRMGKIEILTELPVALNVTFKVIQDEI